MSNVRKNNKHNPSLVINYGEYWDFYINHDDLGHCGMISSAAYDDDLMCSIDLCDSECISGDTIMSSSKYTWASSISNESVLTNISYTGIDNGLFTYRKDRISNKDFLDILRKSSYKIHQDDTRLKLNAVSGNTLKYEYPLSIGDCDAKLNGGFFQGFFKTKCNQYQVFPSNFHDGDVLNIEVTLRKCDLEKESNNTINDSHPSNKGIFFYLGTRAENKWIYEYDKTNPCDTLGIGDFVDGGNVDKSTYIIGDFKNVDPSHEELDDEYMDLYTTFGYYNQELYDGNPCEFDDMYDYLDFNKKAKIIDETADHDTIECVCGSNRSVLRPYRNGCGCQLRYRVESRLEGENKGISISDTFGDDYLANFNGIANSTDCEDYIEDELDISDFDYELDNGLSVKDANQYYFYTDNKFLMFDRTDEGMTVDKWVDGTQFMYYGRKSQFKGNLFMLMDRTPTGYTVNDMDNLIEEDANSYDTYSDVYDNALAFRITDNGEIGYRILTKDCSVDGDDKSLMIEGYSNYGVIPNCEWCVVNCQILFLGGDRMKFMFYVNGKLVYVTKELPRIRLRELNDLYDKQEGVPFNMSLGGGTQGLADTVQLNYMLEADRVYPLEKYFCGSFIGYVKKLRIYGAMLSKEFIEDNYINTIKYLTYS